MKQTIKTIIGDRSIIAGPADTGLNSFRTGASTGSVIAFRKRSSELKAGCVSGIYESKTLANKAISHNDSMYRISVMAIDIAQYPLESME